MIFPMRNALKELIKRFRFPAPVPIDWLHFDLDLSVWKHLAQIIRIK